MSSSYRSHRWNTSEDLAYLQRNHIHAKSAIISNSQLGNNQSTRPHSRQQSLLTIGRTHRAGRARLEATTAR
ncbi:hypothetical protein [Phaffia rhodozyma]|uniref:Uncharacterized protein n=1 Tax=Phaffia rhodozyma TaxID=264483 RepID=A0A0F7SFL1_PHARH|nr:hypothetical protein [Phaffia rhodozyma]